MSDQAEAGRSPFDQWAILELFGHQRLAGRVTEAEVGGCAFLRVDVPEADGAGAFTRFYGQGAIYSMTLVDESVARRAAAGLAVRPVTVYLPPALPAPTGDYEDGHGFAGDPRFEDDEDDEEMDGPDEPEDGEDLVEPERPLSDSKEEALPPPPEDTEADELGPMVGLPESRAEGHRS